MKFSKNNALDISLSHIRVEMRGFEPLTPCLQGRCSPNWATPPFGLVFMKFRSIKEWAWEDSNFRPHAYQACALTGWATSPWALRRSTGVPSLSTYYIYVTSFRMWQSFWGGGHLFSHTVSSAVPSAAYVLTIVFGMGTGVTHKRIATTIFYCCSRRIPLPISTLFTT